MSKKTNYRGSYTQHNKFGYFCLGCYNYTKKKYYLKKMEDPTGIAWRCPHCNYMIADFVMKIRWKEFMKECTVEGCSNKTEWIVSFKALDDPIMLRNIPSSSVQIWHNNIECPICGQETKPEFRASETGYSYCSYDCAKVHVEADYKEGVEE